MDGWWSAGVIATGASLLQGAILHFVGAPPRGDVGWSAGLIATGASLLRGALPLGSGGEGGVDVLQGGQGVVAAQGVQTQA